MALGNDCDGAQAALGEQAGAVQILRVGTVELAVLDQSTAVHGVQHAWLCAEAEIGCGVVAAAWECGGMNVSLEEVRGWVNDR